MRTTYPLAVILALGLATAFFAGSGFNAIVDGSQERGPAAEQLSEKGNSSTLNQDQNLSADRASDGTIAGLVLSTGGSVIKFVQMVSLLPLTLQRLGFPSWFAGSVGSVFYIISGIGIFQFISGRVLQ